MQKRFPLPKSYVEELNKNKYVAKATEWVVIFTPEFKQLAYDEYHRGKTTRQIFIEHSFDVEILGTKRLENFKTHIFKRKAEGKGFEDSRTSNCRKESKSTESQMAKRIRELEHLNKYLEQENEFLKKIQELEKTYGGKVKKQK